MGVMIGFMVGYVLGTRAGDDGYEELKATLRSITSSEEVKDLLSGGFSLLSDVVRSGREVLAERTGDGPVVRRVA